MLKNFLSVGSFTLLSRLSGLLREIIVAAMLGAGPVADAFFTALRIPNHFRTIFAEGAFSAAFVPAYTRLRVAEGETRANLFQGRLLTLLLLSTGGLTLLALLFTPAVLELLAPGFRATPERYQLLLELTRITFPYLMLITLVTLWSGALNAAGKFALAAAAPITLNLCIIGALLAAGQASGLFASPGHAAAWGVFAAGVIEVMLLAWAAERAGVLAPPHLPRRDSDIGAFFKAFVPAVIGSAGTQIAMFADTIIASLLPVGSVAAINYADRFYQLPIGLIAVAAGTVLLPEMSRKLAEKDEAGALKAQNRVFGLTSVLTLPFVVAFMLLPDLIMMGLYGRGAFNADAARAAGAVLAAYGIGLPAIVLIRAAVASFQARGDTKTPMIIALIAVGVNVMLKIALMDRLGAPGLAFATSVGAWVNLLLLVAIGMKRGVTAPDLALLRILGAALLAAFALGYVIAFVDAPVARAMQRLPALKIESRLVTLGLIGLVVYASVFLAGAKLMRVRLRA